MAGYEGSFLSQLSHQDLARLRGVVRRFRMEHYPTEFMTDREADRIIESIGPQVAERMIEKLVSGRIDRELDRRRRGLLPSHGR